MLRTVRCLIDMERRLIVKSHEHRELSELLKEKGRELIEISSNKLFPDETASHADMAVFSFNDGTVVVDASRKELAYELGNMGYDVHITERACNGIYPNDVLLNCFTLKGHLVCNTKYVSSVLLHLAREHGFELLHVNQGYAKCSTLVVGNQTVITDDVSIHNACTSIGAKSLLIEKGSIYLSDRHYGFIGGASCVIDNEVIFLGQLSTHTSGNEIKQFLDCNGINFVEMNGQLKDIGGVVSI